MFSPLFVCLFLFFLSSSNPEFCVLRGSITEKLDFGGFGFFLFLGGGLMWENGKKGRD